MLGSNARKISSIDVYDLPLLRRKFEATKRAFHSSGKPAKPIWVFHGTSPSTVRKIVTEGFKVGGVDTAVVNGSAYGRGVYCATGPHDPLSYGKQKTVILAKALVGVQGASERSGYDSWTPRNDWVIFKRGEQLLPVYVVNIDE